MENLETYLSKLTSRNLGLISEDEQKSINQKTILFAGCGVGSTIALSAARAGFSKFIVVDGDTVEESNLNRQGYLHSHIGKNKAKSLKELIHTINPYAEVEAIPHYLDENNANSIIKNADYVFDAIDPESPVAILFLHRTAREMDKTIIIPLDIGWGAGIYVLNNNTPTYEELIGLPPNCDSSTISPEEMYKKFISFFVSKSPEYVKSLISDIAQGKIKKYPQPSTASNLLATLSTMTLINLSLNKKVKLAPDWLHFDPSEAMSAR